MKIGDRYMVGDVVSFQCDQGYSLQVRLFLNYFLTCNAFSEYFNRVMFDNPKSFKTILISDFIV